LVSRASIIYACGSGKCGRLDAAGGAVAVSMQGINRRPW
jgi:hypothetical protein